MEAMMHDISQTKKPTCRQHGRDFRLTDVYGKVVKQIVA
jgi:hypothetical protein